MAEALKTTIRTSTSFTKIIWKNLYWIILAIIIVPSIISSIKVAINTDNPSYPLVLLGSKITNSDNSNYILIHDLREDKYAVVGMEKPSTGYWKHTVYYWKYFWNVIWEIITNTLFMFLPFSILLRIMLYKDTSKKTRAWTVTAKIYLIYIFIVNLLIVIYGLLFGNRIIEITKGSNELMTIWNIILFSLPFKGLYLVGEYIVKDLILGM